jgi:hypothetical protein
MDKLYWIACDDKDTALFEGRYQGRTRGGALKFLKETIGRKSLNGLVFTITEIPVPLIREIVAEILAGKPPAAVTTPTPAPVIRPEVPSVEPPAPPAPPAPAAKPAKKSAAPTKTAKTGNPGLGDEIWTQARAFWQECGSVSKTAEKFGLSPNSIKTRVRREGWRK